MSKQSRLNMPPDVFNANAMLDIYEQYNQVLRNLNVFISNCVHRQDMPNSYIEKLMDLGNRTTLASIDFENALIEYVDTKGIREIIEKERFMPDND